MNISLKTPLRTGTLAFGLTTLLSACGAQQPQSTASRDLVSGVTSSNGGGMVPANYSSFLTRTGASGPTFDTGNMAYPEPLPQGNLGTTRVP
jgi:hypothetical protein